MLCSSKIKESLNSTIWRWRIRRGNYTIASIRGSQSSVTGANSHHGGENQRKEKDVKRGA